MHDNQPQHHLICCSAQIRFRIVQEPGCRRVFRRVCTPCSKLQGDNRSVIFIYLFYDVARIDLRGRHAGYTYSGPAAAWAYKSIDTGNMYVLITSTVHTTNRHLPSRRVFILGPSHHVYLDGCALTGCQKYATPLGDLPIDRDSASSYESPHNICLYPSSCHRACWEREVL